MTYRQRKWAMIISGIFLLLITVIGIAWLIAVPEHLMALMA